MTLDILPLALWQQNLIFQDKILIFSYNKLAVAPLIRPYAHHCHNTKWKRKVGT